MEQHQYTILSVLTQPAVCSAGPGLTVSVLSAFPSQASAMAWFISLLWPSQPQFLKFSWTRGAGCCKPLTPTHYFHPPHKHQMYGYKLSPWCCWRFRSSNMLRYLDWQIVPRIPWPLEDEGDIFFQDTQNHDTTFQKIRIPDYAATIT